MRLLSLCSHLLKFLRLLTSPFPEKHTRTIHTQNLKKSWHPSTFSNLERVWKAEQKDEAERKKIAQLQQELKEERSREEMQRAAEDAGVVK